MTITTRTADLLVRRAAETDLVAQTLAEYGFPDEAQKMAEAAKLIEEVAQLISDKMEKYAQIVEQDV